MTHHVLLLVNSYVTAEDPRRGAIFRLHIDTYLDAGWQVGLLAIAQHGGRASATTPLIEVENYRDAVIVRDHTQANWFSHVRVPLHWSALFAARGFSHYLSAAGRPDIIHAHGLYWAGFTAQRIWQRHGVPYVLTEHMSNFLEPQTDRPLRRELCSILRHARARLPVSESLGLSLEQEFGAAATPWQAIPNMIDPLFLQSTSTPSDTFNFVTLGRLAPVKGYDILLQAFASRFRDQKTKLIIGGDGPLREQLEQLAQTLGIGEQVVFKGWLSRADAANLLTECSAYVLSSHHETFGIPILEAFASGIPVVVTDCGGPSGLVNESNGLIVPPGDLEALAEGMWEMFTSADRYDGNIIREQCRTRFAPESVMTNFAAVYEAALTGEG